MSTKKRDPSPAELLRLAIEWRPESPNGTPLEAKPEPRVVLRPQEAAAYVGVSMSTLWRWNAQGTADFPPAERRRDAGRNVTFWWRDVLDAWMTKQGDRAWRTGIPNPLHSAEIIQMGNQALWVAHLLILDFFEIWGGLTPDPSPEGTEAMWHFVTGRVDQLLRDAPEETNGPRGYPVDAELSAYLVTLRHCQRVMRGLDPPQLRGPMGFPATSYRRGLYTPNKGGK